MLLTRTIITDFEPRCDRLLARGGKRIASVAINIRHIYYTMNNRYQLAVIGAGSGGREAALAAAQHGLRVVLIEKDTLGGTCLHRGFYCLRALRACVETDKYRAKSSNPEMETKLPDWITTQRKVSSRLTQAWNKQLERAGVKIRFGRATLIEAGKIGLASTHGIPETLEAEYIVLATGSRPKYAAGEAKTRCVNSDELLARSDRPRHLLVVGGGYVGCEFASIFRALGSTVTIAEKCQRLLPGWDEAVGDFIVDAMRSAGIEVHLGVTLDMSRLEEGADPPAFMLGEGTRGPRIWFSLQQGGNRMWRG